MLALGLEGIVADDMGTFRTNVEIENPARPGDRRLLRTVLVDTGAELSWIPATILEPLGIERKAIHGGLPRDVQTFLAPDVSIWL